MPKIILIFLLIFPLGLLAQPDAADTIIWSGTRLAWDNFKGNCDTVVYNRQYSATTFWRVRYQYKPFMWKGEVSFTVYAWFAADKSWVRPNNLNNNDLLLHEQGHFDLAELLARQFRQQLSETTFSRAGYADSVKLIFGKLLADATATQTQYDAETNHGMNRKQQKKWQGIIAAELKKLEALIDKNVTVRLVK